ncbi:MAG TPA: hypothetical protein VHY37_09820 [Tepidisphaeraceae bacterium]|nr:hypothetical protein [Tepidisphaeraceae bacterium]
MSEQSEVAATAGVSITEPARTGAGEPIVARAGSYYRNARYLVCGMIFIFGLWFCYDGFVRYPAYNQHFEAMSPEQRVEQHMETPHDALGLFMQKAIGVTLPPVSILMLAYFLYRSRGEYRLEGQTLYVPSHPPVPIDRITELNRSQWDRKGIMIVHYALADRPSARLKLDDFLYDRKGTDVIVAALTQQLFPTEASPGEKPAE